MDIGDCSMLTLSVLVTCYGNDKTDIRHLGLDWVRDAMKSLPDGYGEILLPTLCIFLLFASYAWVLDMGQDGWLRDTQVFVLLYLGAFFLPFIFGIHVRREMFTRLRIGDFS